MVASSKQRAHLRRAVSTEKAKLELCVSKYNALSTMIDDFESTTVADIINGDFPWSSLTGMCFCVLC